MILEIFYEEKINSRESKIIAVFYKQLLNKYIYYSVVA